MHIPAYPVNCSDGIRSLISEHPVTFGLTPLRLISCCQLGAYLKGVHPVSTGIVVPALARPEWVVEIEATAVIPD